MRYIKELAEVSYSAFFPLVNKIKIYFKSLGKDIRFMNWDISLEEYLALSLFLSILSIVFTFIISLVVMWILFRIIDYFLIFLSILYGLIVGVLVFVYLIGYPKLAKTDYEKEIEDNMPFFLLYLYGFVSSGINILNAFRMIANRKELGSLNREIKYLIYLTDVLGYDLLSALIEVAKRTPPTQFKEFLYELVSVIRSGGSISDLVKEFSRSSLYYYELKLKSFSEKVTFLLTMYTFLFIALPLTLLIVAFLMAYVSNSINILSSLRPFMLGFIPMSYIVYLYILYLVQPKI